MTAYRRQVDYIQQHYNLSIEVNTIDSYQGREKRVIIWTITWTNNSSKKSELLRDERRVNVALTRGKQKLIIIGCRKSCDEIPILYELNKLIEEKNGFVKIEI
ncbi:unnamed protein product [Caenorhabditis angaria]|uniref:DNA2/NAM7 helicase-like C-terminal domain-containing protein n=1 Tax=Caenorhabditis angaria TaxID=860376 RepID=A0A9P1IAQ7_9PELO|nr:unnamed protein product [Caenorhabditis angaria]